MNAAAISGAPHWITRSAVSGWATGWFRSDDTNPAAGDGGYRVHGLVDVVERVVKVEAQATARGRVQAERVMGERRAMAAGA